jgi:hypothetical protein
MFTCNALIEYFAAGLSRVNVYLFSLSAFFRVRTGALGEFRPTLEDVRMEAQCCVLGERNPLSYDRVDNQGLFVAERFEVHVW